MIFVDAGCGCGLAGMAGLGFTCRTLTASGTTTPDV
nr:MAG TPA: putative AdoMet-dependent methyltransferase [Caudoviricetes sp.]